MIIDQSNRIMQYKITFCWNLPKLLSGDCRWWSSSGLFLLTLGLILGLKELALFRLVVPLVLLFATVDPDPVWGGGADPVNCFLNGGPWFCCFGSCFGLLLLLTFFKSFLEPEVEVGNLCSSLSESEGKSYNENLQFKKNFFYWMNVKNDEITREAAQKIRLFIVCHHWHSGSKINIYTHEKLGK